MIFARRKETPRSRAVRRLRWIVYGNFSFSILTMIAFGLLVFVFLPEARDWARSPASAYYGKNAIWSDGPWPAVFWLQDHHIWNVSCVAVIGLFLWIADADRRKGLAAIALLLGEDDAVKSAPALQPGS